jgi:hypothetical protein
MRARLQANTTDFVEALAVAAWLIIISATGVPALSSKPVSTITYGHGQPTPRRRNPSAIGAGESFSMKFSDEHRSSLLA